MVRLGLVHYNNEGRYPMVGLIVVGILLAIGGLSLVAGTDTRDGFTDTRRPV